MRKIFLVAERLLAEDGTTSMHLKSKNEELNWAVNYELGILEPFVEDPELVPGPRHPSLTLAPDPSAAFLPPTPDARLPSYAL